jgi:hypothetical protein
MSVKIVEYRIRLNSEQKPFLALILQGGIEIVKSANGNVYATAKKASLATTFDEATCKSLIGTEMPGQIVREECEPYQYTVEETGEVLMLSHRYVYTEQEQPVQQDFTKIYQGTENGVKQMA